MADITLITKATVVINEMTSKLKESSGIKIPSEYYKNEMHTWMNAANTTIIVTNASIAETDANPALATNPTFVQAKGLYQNALTSYLAMEKEVRYKLQLLAITGEGENDVTANHSINNPDGSSSTAPPPSYSVAMGVSQGPIHEVHIVEVAPRETCTRWKIYLYTIIIGLKIGIIASIYHHTRSSN